MRTLTVPKQALRAAGPDMLLQPVVRGIAPVPHSCPSECEWRALALSHRHNATHLIKARKCSLQHIQLGNLRRPQPVVKLPGGLNASSGSSNSSSGGSSSLPDSATSQAGQYPSDTNSAAQPTCAEDVPLVEASSVLEEERESSRSGTFTSQHVDEEFEERYDDEEYPENEGERMNVHCM